MRSASRKFRQCTAVALAVMLNAPFALAQTAPSQMQAITPVRPSSFVAIRPYKAPYVPAIQLSNSGRIASLTRAGNLYLTAQDAVALAIENNIDVEIARYNPITDEWRLERSEAGGALPGVPSGTSQVGSVARGQGVRGSQAAAGVSTSGGGTSGTGTSNATISQIGPVTPALDPVVQDNTTFSHTSSPQANLAQSAVANLIDNTRSYTDSVQQGLLTGGQASVTFTESYLNENAPTNLLNPTYAPNLSLSVQQNFLSGFGFAVNSRNINVAKVNLQIDDLNFKSQVISVVVNTLNLYYGLVADYQDLRAKQSAVEVAQQFYANNKKQVEIGTMAPLDITNAEAQVASSEQDLVVSQTTLVQQELSLKNVLSRTGTADPLLANVHIVPLDRIDVPEQDNLPPLSQLVSRARANRVDIAAERMNLQVAALSALGTSNGVLPQLAGFASTSNAGLAGKAQPVPLSPQEAARLPAQQFPPGIGPCPANYHTNLPCEFPDPYVVGGLQKAIGQVFRRNYPSENAGVFFAATLRNRQSQADYAIDQLTIRQTQLQDQRDLNQVAVDVANQVTALRQARARYQAAVRNRILEEQLLDAEQKKFSLGASTPYNVVTQQRDLATAQSNEVAALVAYSNARVALDQTTGSTLEVNHISLDESKSGRIVRPSTLPESLPAHP
ncbi:MAG: TolC family protein [Acidobacteriaceae bacterium]|nr:TolC family protein [Acidobacteriaceae bacterium]